MMNPDHCPECDEYIQRLDALEAERDRAYEVLGEAERTLVGYHEGRYVPDGIRVLLAERDRLQEFLAVARTLLVFADGVILSETGFALADLYAKDCEWAQDALAAAGCWPHKTVGRFSEKDAQ